MRMNCAICIALTAIVMGCAGPSYLERRQATVQQLISSKNWAAVADAAYVDLGSNDATSASVRALLKAQAPSMRGPLNNRIRQEIDRVREIDEIVVVSRAIEISRADGLITEADAADLNAAATHRVQQRLDARELRPTLADSSLLDAFPGLDTPANRRTIFANSLDKLTTGSALDFGGERLLRYVIRIAIAPGAPPELGADLRAALPKIKLSSQQVEEILRSEAPALADSYQRSRSITLHVETAPPDRLFEEDVKDALRRSLEFVEFAGSSGPYPTITVGKLALEYRETPEHKQTIVYRDYEVDLLGAVLLMPKNASYQYEYVTEGGEIEAAFLIRVERGGKVITDRVFRTHFEQSFSACENARIVNVFGGSNRAEFIANDDMKVKCAGGGSRPDRRAMITQVMEGMRARLKGRCAASVVSAHLCVGKHNPLRVPL